jgi:hypothetical protein
LIDVQQTLIANPNPLKNTNSFNPGKTNKSDISQLLFFEPILLKNIYPNENRPNPAVIYPKKT